jgi:hypothetical protein
MRYQCPIFLRVAKYQMYSCDEGLRISGELGASSNPFPTVAMHHQAIRCAS